MNAKQPGWTRGGGGGGARGRAGGFTLIELMVAIAAMAVLSLGLAQIFSVAGRTVSAGKRVSALTQFAAALERQLRADVSRLTRDGFLIVRNELANNGALIRTAAEGGAARERRVDQLEFFATGQFESARQAYQFGRTATAPTARVWWGHGQQQGAGANGIVRLGDDNSAAPGLGRPGPDQFAADWILARQITLLAQPSAMPRDDHPSITALGAQGQDNDIQVGLQPASPELFRFTFAGASSFGPGSVAPGNPLRFSNDPQTSSGAVDAATTDLGTIRRVIMELPPPNPAGDYSSYNNNVPGVFSGAAGKTRDIQEWMKLALPADADAGRRPRVEAAPPNALGIGWGTPADAASRADQLALASAAFMPNCTQFVVEWSFGDAVPPLPASRPDAGRLNWHGLRRLVDLDGNGALNPASGDYLVNEYDGKLTRPVVRARDGTTLPDGLIPYSLIHGRVGDTPTNTLYSFFGYVDPLDLASDSNGQPYDQLSGNPLMVNDVNGDGKYQPEQGDVLNWPETFPWPWPKLLRITVTLADPSDPRIEQTFQFILEVPQGSESAK